MSRAVRWAVRSASATAGLLCVHTAVNVHLMRRPPDAATTGQVTEPVSVVLPVRDERRHVGNCLAALLASVGVTDLEVLVYDDSSTDGTAAVVADVARTDPRVRLLTGDNNLTHDHDGDLTHDHDSDRDHDRDGDRLPPGWLGKPYACARGADAARGSVLVFVDADVRLEPDGLARAVALLRQADLGLDLVCPYPRQQARTAAERCVQPLLQWSWLTLLPLRLAERSPRPSLTAANGQLLCVDAAAYRRAGGHGAVADRVLEDVELLRAVKRAGGRGVVADGSELAVARMYDGWGELRDGYAKSLWAAGGGPLGSVGQVGLLSWVYLVPPLAALAGSRAGLAGYLAAVAGRVVTARASGGRAWPDAAAHPLSVAVLGYLTALSWWRRQRGTASWKGRPVTRAGQSREPGRHVSRVVT